MARFPAIPVSQPLGTFYAASIPASFLLKTTYPIRAERLADESARYAIRGTQRELRQDRLKEISRYIGSQEAAFPNSVILGANVDASGLLISDDELRWYVEEDNGTPFIVIPTEQQCASIIDGQHRLEAFEYVSDTDFDLLCSIYLDLPIQYHAYLFATINFNQRPVDKSLAYQLYGFNLEDEDPETWSPEKLCVYLARLLNEEKGSPFRHQLRIGIADQMSPENVRLVSFATIVDGLLRLMSSNPRRDRDEIASFPRDKRNRKLLSATVDRSPLRSLYLESNDLGLYQITQNYFDAVKDIFWKNATEDSYISRTVGIQALFDVLRLTFSNAILSPNDSKAERFRSLLAPAEHIDFSQEFFQASGIGRTRIRNSIAILMKLVPLEEIRYSEDEHRFYAKLLDEA